VDRDNAQDAREQAEDDTAPERDSPDDDALALDPTDPATSPLTDDTRKPVLERQVLDELLAARKTPEGLTQGQMARSPILTALLGDSDPVAALDHLLRSVMEYTATTDDPLAVTAAAYSLGLARELDSRADTHLARLEAFGEQFGFEQRQARRYSDKGVKELTRLVTTTWMRQAQPELHLIVIGLSPGSIALTIDTQVRVATPMRTPRLGLSRDDESMQQVELEFDSNPEARSNTDTGTVSVAPLDSDHVHRRLARPMRIGLGANSTRLLLRWAPLWPKFTVAVMEQVRLDADVVVEAFGNTVGVVVSGKN